MRAIRAQSAVFAGATAITIATASVAQPSVAQQWPERSILVVSPFGGGTTNDLVADLVLDHVGKQFGHPFIIENRPGGGGTVGVASVVGAKPDGYTLLLSSSFMSSAVILHKSLPYDALRDLEPVAMFGGQPSVLVAAPDKGFKSVADLVAAAKAKPGELKFASVGFGSASYFAGERFRVAADVNVRHVPYRGPVEALTDLMAGRVDFYFVPIPPAQPLIKQGKVVALAVSTPFPINELPGVPPLVQAGYVTAPYLFWCGLSAPANTPHDIVDKLNAAIGNVLNDPVIARRFWQMDFSPNPMKPERYGKFFADDVAAMKKLATDAHIEPTD
jgi:tripartite-type tricarboxylate transporter receptor subunit TctC